MNMSDVSEATGRSADDTEILILKLDPTVPVAVGSAHQSGLFATSGG